MKTENGNVVLETTKQGFMDGEGQDLFCFVRDEVAEMKTPEDSTLKIEVSFWVDGVKHSVSKKIVELEEFRSWVLEEAKKIMADNAGSKI